MHDMNRVRMRERGTVRCEMHVLKPVTSLTIAIATQSQSVTATELRGGERERAYNQRGVFYRIENREWRRLVSIRKGERTFVHSPRECEKEKSVVCRRKRSRYLARIECGTYGARAAAGSLPLPVLLFSCWRIRGALAVFWVFERRTRVSGYPIRNHRDRTQHSAPPPR